MINKLYLSSDLITYFKLIYVSKHSRSKVGLGIENLFGRHTLILVVVLSLLCT